MFSDFTLPPGQTLVKDWPVLDLGVQPDVSKAKFRLRLEGLVENRLALDWDGFMALPQTEMVRDIHCVTQWMSPAQRLRGRACSSSQLQRASGRGPWLIVKLQCARSMAGAGPLLSTGKSCVRYWPGGRRRALSVPMRRPVKPRVVAMSSLL